MTSLFRMVVREEHDIFVLRQRGREVAAALGMERQDQVRVATALSEVGRQMLENGGAGVEFEVRTEPRPSLAIVVTAPDLVRGTDGLAAAERLMDRVEVGDHQVVPTRRLPGQVSVETLQRVRAELAASQPTTALDELSVQNQQLVTALEEVQAHRDELLRVNEELEETNHGVMALYGQLSQELEQTNQGVVALYAELEERSGQLREASEAKSRFLANVSHELRAPVTAIIGLSRLLLDPRSDPLTGEQGHQLQLVQTSAADLLARVNDLLDLAKAEANRIEPQWVPVDLASVLGQLRGTLRSMAKPGVELVVSSAEPVADLVSDEVLLSQVLRNLLTNALKFTAEGSVELRATVHGDRILFVVSDTGIGIPAAEQSRVFEEFHQVRGSQQIGTTGTGLGLPYARRLTTLLGGQLTMTSVVDEGSAFTVDLPLRPEPAEVDLPRVGKALVAAPERTKLVEALAGMAGTVVEAADVRSAAAIAARELPDVVFSAFGTDLLDVFAADELLATVPVVVVTVSGFPGTFPRATVVLDEDEVNQGVMATVLRAIAVVDDS